MDPEQQRADVILAASAAQEPMVCGLVWGFSCEIIERGYGKTFYFHDPNPDKPEPNRRFRTRSALGRTGYFWMICRFTSARIFPQRGCKLNEPNGFKPLWRVHDRIICALSPINFAHKRQRVRP